MQTSWHWGGLGSALLHGALGALLIDPVTAPAEEPASSRIHQEFTIDLDLIRGGSEEDLAQPESPSAPPLSVRPRVSQGKAPAPPGKPPVAPEARSPREAEGEPQDPQEASSKVSPGAPLSSEPSRDPAPPAGGEGKGAEAPRGKVSPGYAAMLDSWFSSRVALGGLDLPWEELSRLRVRVSISIGSDRRVSGFSLHQGSGHGAYDARIEAALRAVVASGAQLPPPPEGEQIPGHLALVFRCRSQERCS